MQPTPLEDRKGGAHKRYRSMLVKLAEGLLDKVKLGASPRISSHLLASPRISSHLVDLLASHFRIPPHLPHLLTSPASPHISPHHPTSPQRGR